MSETDADELEEDENEGSTTDVAALMGFGSFGDQHRGKRRRYDDAVIGDGPSPSRNGKGSGSGSNRLPLGTPRARPGPRRATSGPVEPEASDHATSARPLTEQHAGVGAEDEGAADIALAPADPSCVSPRAAPKLAAANPPPTTSGSLPSSLPPKPAPPPVARTAPAPGTGSEAWELRRGVRVAGGDVAYYDASFVEDPWRAWR